MKQLNCLIIDDEPLARQGLQDYCNDISFINIVALCKDALQANDYLQHHEIDLVFLDINMPVLSGLDWLKTLKKSPLVIMTTAYVEHALESYSYEVVDYLVKPISFGRFLQAVNKVHRLTNTLEKEKMFFVKSDQSLKKVLVNDILFLEAMQNYVKIITRDETIITHSTLKDLKENLSNSNFIQTHKSFIVSKMEVNQVIGNQVIIADYKIPISVRLKKEVMEKFM
jgi:DNA-binding LytR/AlgR family response regulator